MARFQYRMENILNVKINLENQAKEEFGAAVQKLEEEREKLAAIREKRAAYMQQYQELLMTRINVVEIELAKSGVSQADDAIKKQLGAIRAAEKNLELARKKLEMVMQERKAQERLKEKAFDEFLREENAREQKEIDELVSYRFGQKAAEE